MIDPYLLLLLFIWSASGVFPTIVLMKYATRRIYRGQSVSVPRWDASDWFLLVVAAFMGPIFPLIGAFVTWLFFKEPGNG